MVCPSRKWLFRISILILLFVIFQRTYVYFIYIYSEEWFYEKIEMSEIDKPVPWDDGNAPLYLSPEEDTTLPIILWWTPFTPEQRVVKECPEGSCLFTQSRTEQFNPNTTAFVFYGTALSWNDLPLPRKPSDLWALLHEESPKNNWMFAHEKGISLFNITSTCSRHSTYPLTTQFLHNLEELTSPVRVPTTEKSRGDLGLVMYVQSDCDPPSDRDSYVEELMKYVKVDSYGRCLHNRDLPESLRDTLTFDSKDLYNIQAQYKFTIAFENAICHDYITEKFWRPLYVGSVPIVRGSPTVKDWAPDTEHSIIVAADFSSPKELADYLKFLDKNDEAYEKYHQFKRTGVTNKMLLEHFHQREWVTGHEREIVQGMNFVEGFECFVCDTVHRRRKAETVWSQPATIVANHNHYNCPMPEPSLKDLLPGETEVEKLDELSSNARSELAYWRYVARCSEMKAAAIHKAIARGGGQTEVNGTLKDACKGLAIE